MQWRWEKYDVTEIPTLNICIQVLDKKCFAIESGGGAVVVGEVVVLVVAEVVRGEWENISHRLLILPSPRHSVRPVSYLLCLYIKVGSCTKHKQTHIGYRRVYCFMIK